MATVARMTGVSQGAISSLLNDRDYGIRVSPATRKKVFDACRQLGYVPNDLRAIVRMYPERGDLAILWPAGAPDLLVEEFGPRFLQGVRESCAAPGSLLTLVEMGGSNNERELPKSILNGVVSRVITVGAFPPAIGQTLKDREIQHVAVETEPPPSGAPTLYPDYERAAHLALEHLHQTGHRNIAVITSDSPGFALREKLLGVGVKAATRELRLTVDRTIASNPEWRFEDGPEIAAKLRGSPLRVTAVFCYSELVAAGLLAGLQAQGKRGSTQLSVISCGDGPISRRIYPAMTTVHIPVEELGRKAVQLLAETEPAAGPVKPVVLPVTLVPRATVVAPPPQP